MKPYPHYTIEVAFYKLHVTVVSTETDEVNSPEPGVVYSKKAAEIQTVKLGVAHTVYYQREKALKGTRWNQEEKTSTFKLEKTRAIPWLSPQSCPV
ncbi:Pre-Mrna-Splicing Factor Cwc25 [Manis pentadactyla]|nr:Pre-Mrna-Splicing Factor Cwc25 [Manis pentadactyla]